jgi:N-acetylmuramoyl-L-alanine amidase
MRKLIFIFVFCAIAMSLFSIEKGWTEAGPRKRVGTIIIEPGHGGRDSGGVGRYAIDGEEVILLEKEVTFGIARILKNKLLETFPDTRVILTREDDVYISLEERIVLANALDSGTNDITLYISIHSNSSFNPGTRGYEFLIPATDHTPDSVELAEKVSREFHKTFGEVFPYRGIKVSPYAHGNTILPVLLAEIGFITNLEDALILRSEHGLDKCADALINGIAAYMRD